MIADDPYQKDWKPVEMPDAMERLKEIDEMLATPELVAIAEEYQKTKNFVAESRTGTVFMTGRGTFRSWPRVSIGGASYAILYREWSERIHSGDVVDRILIQHSGGSGREKSSRSGRV